MVVVVVVAPYRPPLSLPRPLLAARAATPGQLLCCACRLAGWALGRGTWFASHARVVARKRQSQMETSDLRYVGGRDCAAAMRNRRDGAHNETRC